MRYKSQDFIGSDFITEILTVINLSGLTLLSVLLTLLLYRYYRLSLAVAFLQQGAHADSSVVNNFEWLTQKPTNPTSTDSLPDLACNAMIPSLSHTMVILIVLLTLSFLVLVYKVIKYYSSPQLSVHLVVFNGSQSVVIDLFAFNANVHDFSLTGEHVVNEITTSKRYRFLPTMTVKWLDIQMTVNHIRLLWPNVYFLPIWKYQTLHHIIQDRFSTLILVKMDKVFVGIKGFYPSDIAPPVLRSSYGVYYSLQTTPHALNLERVRLVRSRSLQPERRER